MASQRSCGAFLLAGPSKACFRKGLTAKKHFVPQGHAILCFARPLRAERDSGGPGRRNLAPSPHPPSPLHYPPCALHLPPSPTTCGDVPIFGPSPQYKPEKCGDVPVFGPSPHLQKSLQHVFRHTIKVRFKSSQVPSAYPSAPRFLRPHTASGTGWRGLRKRRFEA